MTTDPQSPTAVLTHALVMYRSASSRMEERHTADALADAAEAVIADALIGRMIRDCIDTAPDEPMVCVNLSRHTDESGSRYRVSGSIGQWPDATVLDGVSKPTLVDALVPLSCRAAQAVAR